MKKFFVLASFVLLSCSVFGQDIFRTACQGKLSRLDSLLQTSDLDIRDNRGRSLLHWAVACKQQEVFDVLIGKGLDINSEDHQQQTALHIATHYGNEAFFNAILAAQPNQEWTTTYGGSLMEVAILQNRSNFVQLLIDQGVDVDAKNKRGSTPMEIATRLNNKDIVNQLFRAGGNAGLVRTFYPEGAYVGTTSPNLQPEIFAPNFISTEEHEFGLVFNAAGDEVFFGVDKNGKAEIRYSKRIEGYWTRPKLLLPDEPYSYNDPFLSPDEQRLYFISQRPLDGNGDPKNDHDIWYVERTEAGWSAPINAGPAINSEGSEYYISFTEDGTMYFGSNKHDITGNTTGFDIYTSAYSNGAFQPSQRLGSAINTEHYEADVFVDPKGDYLIFCSIRPEGLGRGDLYISFKQNDGTWSPAVSMGETINTKLHELCPFVTADGKYLMYTSGGDIYWVSTTVFDELRPNK
ncbi:MAG: ankyrin repeat domain-containing protein [Saprospiraceae bacterium]|nr:ankyrin repeat domain-containing protein [Saprospiraceae bacterium]